MPDGEGKFINRPNSVKKEIIAEKLVYKDCVLVILLS